MQGHVSWIIGKSSFQLPSFPKHLIFSMQLYQFEVLIMVLNTLSIQVRSRMDVTFFPCQKCLINAFGLVSSFWNTWLPHCCAMWYASRRVSFPFILTWCNMSVEHSFGSWHGDKQFVSKDVWLYRTWRWREVGDSSQSFLSDTLQGLLSEWSGDTTELVYIQKRRDLKM